MLKPERVVKAYMYTTRLHADSLAEAIVEFDDIHVDIPEGVPGVKPPEEVNTATLMEYENIVRALERMSSLTGISLDAVISELVKLDQGINVESEIKELDDLVGRYLSLRRELDLAKKVKYLLRERSKRIEELEEELLNLELKIKEYYSATLEITEEDPAKLRLGRNLIEIGRGIIRLTSLIETCLDKSMTMDNIKEVLKNAAEIVEEIYTKVNSIEGEVGSDRVAEMKSIIEELKEDLYNIVSKIDEYLLNKDKLDELKAVESMWLKMKERVRRVPELTPLLAEKEPAIAKVSQQISELSQELDAAELTIRNEISSLRAKVGELENKFVDLRDSLISIKVVAAGEAEKRVVELLEEAKPLIIELGKLREEVQKLSKLSDKKEQEKMIKELNELKEKILEKSRRLASYALSIKREAAVQKVRTMIYEGEEVAIATGWVPARKTDEFEKALKDKLGNYLAVEYEEPKEESKAPSKIKIPNILKPVSLLVHDLYGLPSIFEIDPTVITSILFPLMFGMMYGDIGHGLTMALFGLFLYIKFSGSIKKLGGLMVYMGVAAAFFGYLYGMMFFVEVMDPIISPVHDTMKLMALALELGAVAMMIGFFINSVNRVIKGEILEAIFEHGGIATLLMYLFAVIAAIRNEADIGATVKDPLMIPGAVTLLLVTIVFPIIKAKIHNHPVGEGVSEAIVTFLESVLALFSNSLSFIRLAAFAVIHEVFGVLAATSLIGKEVVKISDLHLLMNPLILVAWILINVAVMGLEGMLSFIQSTRLTFYEFFTKFYSAIGRRFKRVSELLALTTYS